MLAVFRGGEDQVLMFSRYNLGKGLLPPTTFLQFVNSLRTYDNNKFMLQVGVGFLVFDKWKRWSSRSIIKHA